jgi:signal transduction histidine kinase
MVGSQYFLLHDATYRTLTLVTFGLSLFLGVLLVKNLRREEMLAIALQEANEGQANLLHIINHQIKGYLTKARLVFDDLLHDGNYNLSEPAKPMIQQGYDSVTEGVNFVQDFLNASNIERGTFTYNMVPVDLKQVVAEQVEKQKDAIQAKGLTLEVNIAEGSYNLTGDQTQVGQAVRNLIDNSVKYTPSGSMWIKLERKDNNAVFSVRDTGVGLSEEVKPKLFTKGGRDKDSQKINVNSTGFGLAFVKGVAEAHKGRVWAESPGPGKGSTFYMELPLNS